MERGIAAAEPEQFVMRAALDDAPLVERQNAVALADCGEAVRDDQHGAAGGDRLQLALDDLLALGIERRRRLVENQDERIGNQRAGDGEALALAAREVDAAIIDERVIAPGQIDTAYCGERVVKTV